MQISMFITFYSLIGWFHSFLNVLATVSFRRLKPLIWGAGGSRIVPLGLQFIQSLVLVGK